MSGSHQDNSVLERISQVISGGDWTTYISPGGGEEVIGGGAGAGVPRSDQDLIAHNHQRVIYIKDGPVWPSVTRRQ